MQEKTEKNDGLSENGELSPELANEEKSNNQDSSTSNKDDEQQEKKEEKPLTEVEKLTLTIEEKDKEIASLKDKMLRVQAQASNDRKRYKQDADLSAFETKKRLLKKVLDIRDNIDRAITAISPDDDSLQSHLDGIKLIANQMDEMFDIEGIKELKAKGEMYDLLKHEIVARIPYNGPENRVIDIIEKGYVLNGKLLRPAKVAISMKVESQTEKTEDKPKTEETQEESASVEENN